MAIIIGFDIGHGETSVGRLKDSKIVLQQNVIGNQDLDDLIIGTHANAIKKIPSLMCKLNGEWVINLQTGEIRNATDYRIGFKAPLIGSKEYDKITDEDKIIFGEFIKLVYNNTVYNGINAVIHNGDNYSVYFACPSGWNNEQAIAYEDFIRNELKIPIKGVIQESRAAFIGAQIKLRGFGDNETGLVGKDRKVLVIDYGSSTIDFTFYDMEETDLNKAISHWGEPIGAKYIEEMLLDYTIKSYDQNQEMVERIYQTEINGRPIGEKMGRNILLFEIRKIKEFFFEKGRTHLVPDIGLYSITREQEHKTLYITTYSDVHKDGYSRDEIENKILISYIKKLQEALEKVKDKIKNVDAILLTGGAARMYFFINMVKNTFPNARCIIDKDDPSLTISRGIAVIGAIDTEAEPLEKKLRNAVKQWERENLKNTLKRICEKEVGKQYYSIITHITSNYENASGANYDTLYHALDEALKQTINSVVFENEIIFNIKKQLTQEIGDKLRDFMRLFYKENFSIDLDFSALSFNTIFHLEEGTINNSMLNMRNVIDKQKFFTADRMKNRNHRERVKLVNEVKNYFNDWSNRLLVINYDWSYDVGACCEVIDNTIENLIKKAKLQMYKTFKYNNNDK
jgi:molecular chaperone DnaK (HSP70)